MAHSLVQGVLPSASPDVQEDLQADQVEDHLFLLHLVRSILGVDTVHVQDSQSTARGDLQVRRAWAHMVQDHKARVPHILAAAQDSQDNHVHKEAHLGQGAGARGPCTCEAEGPCWVGSGTLGVHQRREMPLNYSLRLAHCLLKLHLQVVEALKHFLPLTGQWPETWTVNWMIQLETGMVLVLEKGMA